MLWLLIIIQYLFIYFKLYYKFFTGNKLKIFFWFVSIFINLLLLQKTNTKNFCLFHRNLKLVNFSPNPIMPSWGFWVKRPNLFSPEKNWKKFIVSFFAWLAWWAKKNSVHLKSEIKATSSVFSVIQRFDVWNIKYYRMKFAKFCPMEIIIFFYDFSLNWLRCDDSILVKACRYFYPLYFNNSQNSPLIELLYHLDNLW